MILGPQIISILFRLHSILASARPTRDIHSSIYVLQSKNEPQRKRPNFVTPRLLKTHQRQFTSLTSRKKLLMTPIGTRGIGWVPTIIRSVLKIRYLLLGGAIGGGASLAKQYEEWKKNLPDTDWIKDLMPDVDLNKFSSELIKAGEQIKGKANEIDLDPAVKKMIDFRQWFEKRLDDAIQAADKENPRKIELKEEVEEKPVKKEEKRKEDEKDSNGAILTAIGLKPLSALSLIGNNNEETEKKIEEERKKTDSERKKNGTQKIRNFTPNYYFKLFSFFRGTTKKIGSDPRRIDENSNSIPERN